MSDKIPNIPPGILTPEQVEMISGGADCTATDYAKLIPQLKTAYEDLIEFTVYVMERVAK